jgi:molybdopterin-guanine dinucleotide biosynthesis protein A
VSTGGVVLAGGRSTRMGTAKADLDWHGVPLVVHVATALREALGGGPVVVVRAPGQALAELPAWALVAEDRAPDRGPLEGLATGLAAVEAAVGHAVVVATDQPFAPALAGRLLAAAHAGDDVVAFTVDGRVQPLGALYATRLAATARARLGAAGGDGSLRGLLAAVRTRELTGTPEDARALRSLDTPQAYAAALRS